MFLGIAMASISTKTTAPWVSFIAVLVFAISLLHWALALHFRKKPQQTLLMDGLSMVQLSLMSQVICNSLYFYHMGQESPLVPILGFLGYAGACAAVYRFYDQRFRGVWEKSGADATAKDRTLYNYAGGFSGIGLVIGGILAKTTGGTSAVIIGFTGFLLFSFLLGAVASIKLLKFNLFKTQKLGGKHYV